MKTRELARTSTFYILCLAWIFILDLSTNRYIASQKALDFLLLFFSPKHSHYPIYIGTAQNLEILIVSLLANNKIILEMHDGPINTCPAT